MGPMANPFYHDLGLSKDAVGTVRGSIGLVATLLGIAAGGFSALRFGYMQDADRGRRCMKILVIANFATLAYVGPDLRVFGAVMFADNFGIGFAGVALVTYMSSLTSLGYTATQYALLSSAYTYVGKFAKGFSGVMVERLRDRPPAARRLRSVLHRRRPARRSRRSSCASSLARVAATAR